MDKLPFHLSFSSLDFYNTCPYHFHQYRILKKDPGVENEYYMHIGKLVQAIFEQVTNHRLYKKYSLSELERMIDLEIDRSAEELIYFIGQDKPEIKSGFYFFNGINPAPIAKTHTPTQFKKHVMVYKRPFRRYIKREVITDLDAVECEVICNETFTHEDLQFDLTGRLDFRITNPDGTVTILDGKRRFSNYVHEEQLHFYTLLEKKTVKSLAFWGYTEDQIRRITIRDRDEVANEVFKNIKEVYSSYTSNQWEKRNCQFCVQEMHENLKNGTEILLA